MNLPSSKSLFAGVLRAVSLLALAVSAHAVSAQVVLVQDSFTLNGTTRIAGASLDGLAPEQGAGTWKAGSIAAVFSSDGAMTNPDAHAEARISIPALAAITTLSADIQVGSGVQFAGFGFAPSDNASGWTSGSNRASLWFALYSSGSWNVFNGGTTLASGSIAGFSTSQSYAIDIIYDPTSGATSVTLSGLTELYSGTLSSEALDPASLAAAGFRIQRSGTNPGGSARIDDFLITTAIPEPNSIALLMGGLAVVGAVARRRARR